MNKTLEQISKEVFARRPALLSIFNNHGSEILKNYITNSWEVPKTEPGVLFLSVFKKQIESAYGAGMATQAYNQLLQKPLVSTIDHLGIWNHPIFVNSSLMYSLHFQANELAIVLATESISLNNTSSWSGSLMLHNQKRQLTRHSFFPDSKKTLPVFSVPPLTQHNIDHITKSSQGIFTELFKKININKIIGKDSFSIQASKLSSAFWAVVFPSAPKLIYFPLETLILEYLGEVLQSSENIISKLVLTKEGRGLWKKYFINEHTFMFWGLNERGRRVFLTGLPEKREELINLITRRKIYPSSPLCFLALLEAGVACVGGFTQTTWLTQIKEKILTLLGELSQPSLPEQIAQVPTKNFAESSLAWLKINGEYLTPTAFDLFLTKKDYYPVYRRLAEKLTLEQSINLAMPEIYSVIVPKAEQVKGFSLDKNTLDSALTDVISLL